MEAAGTALGSGTVCEGGNWAAEFGGKARLPATVSPKSRVASATSCNSRLDLEDGARYPPFQWLGSA